VEGFDYEDKFAPMVKWGTLKALIALIAQYKWRLSHLDVKTTFLNVKLKEVYMVQPKGFEVPRQEEKVCKLLKSLYGLIQALRAWYEKIDNYLKQQRLVKSFMDHVLHA
jgi:hypothetical protein